jgi:hypothetical protein
LERVASDPKSPRAAEARKLLDEIEAVRRTLRDANRAREVDRALGEHPQPDSNRQRKRKGDPSQTHRGKEEPRTRRGGAPDPNRKKIRKANFKAPDVGKKGVTPPIAPKVNVGGGRGMPKTPTISTKGALRLANSARQSIGQSLARHSEGN